jgi:hypothetical protein
MNEEIMLEDEVKCRFTGFKGIVVSKTEFVNGCIQFGLLRKYKEGQSLMDVASQVDLDSQNLIIVKRGPRHKTKIEIKPRGGRARLRARF